jgi:hypothetical protein
VGKRNQSVFKNPNFVFWFFPFFFRRFLGYESTQFRDKLRNLDSAKNNFITTTLSENIDKKEKESFTDLMMRCDDDDLQKKNRRRW